MDKKLFVLLVILLSCVNAFSQNKVTVRQEGNLKIFIPHFTRIDLVTETMPSKSDKDVIFCCAAAFTGSLLKEFKHSNIAGHHVSAGKFYDGYECNVNNGVFTWSKNDGWHFYNYTQTNSVPVLKKAAQNGGMGFGQNILIHNGKEFTGAFKAHSQNIYRALCLMNNELCIIQSAIKQSYADFKSELVELGVKEALYLDMGTGWNYSWYRDGNGNVVELFYQRGIYCTNWITFYSE